MQSNKNKTHRDNKTTMRMLRGFSLQIIVFKFQGETPKKANHARIELALTNKAKDRFMERGIDWLCQSHTVFGIVSGRQELRVKPTPKNGIPNLTAVSPNEADIIRPYINQPTWSFFGSLRRGTNLHCFSHSGGCESDSLIWVRLKPQLHS